MFKTLFFALIITLFTPFHQGCLIAQTQPADNKVSSSNTKKATTALVIGALAVAIWLTAEENTKPALFDQIRPGALAANFAQEYSTTWITTLAHECGHNAAQYLMSGRYGTIHMGTNEAQKIDASKTRPFVTLDGSSPLAAYTEQVLTDQEQMRATIAQFLENYCTTHNIARENLTDETLEAIKREPIFINLRKSLKPARAVYALFLLAGGLTGAGTSQIIHHISGKKSFLNEKTAIHLINALVPADQQSDGTLLWRECLCAPESLIHGAMVLNTPLEIFVYLACALADQSAHPQASPLTRSLVGLLNFFMRGYLHFHA